MFLFKLKHFLLVRTYFFRLILKFQTHKKALIIKNAITNKIYNIIAAMVIRWSSLNFAWIFLAKEAFDVSVIGFSVRFCCGHVATQS